MSLRTGAKPFTSTREVRRLFKAIYPIARNWLHVPSVSGSCALNGKGNDLDIIIVPFWNDPTDAYPTRMLLESVRHMIAQIVEAVGGEICENYKDENGHKVTCTSDYWSGIIYTSIKLPGGQFIDIKTYPGEYGREDVRKTLGHQSMKRADVLCHAFPYPKYDPNQKKDED